MVKEIPGTHDPRPVNVVGENRSQLYEPLYHMICFFLNTKACLDGQVDIVIYQDCRESQVDKII